MVILSKIVLHRKSEERAQRVGDWGFDGARNGVAGSPAGSSNKNGTGLFASLIDVIARPDMLVSLAT
jgi:hypothetical protein